MTAKHGDASYYRMIAQRLERGTLSSEDKAWLLSLVRSAEQRREWAMRFINAKTDKPERSRHYDSEGYCDNPARGY